MQSLKKKTLVSEVNVQHCLNIPHLLVKVHVFMKHSFDVPRTCSNCILQSKVFDLTIERLSGGSVSSNYYLQHQRQFIYNNIYINVFIHTNTYQEQSIN